MKNIRIFYLNFFLFLVVKFSIYLNRCVFVMYLPYVGMTDILFNDAEHLPYCTVVEY